MWKLQRLKQNVRPLSLSLCEAAPRMVHVKQPALQPPAVLARGEAMWRLQRPRQNVEPSSLWPFLLLLRPWPQALLSR